MASGKSSLGEQLSIALKRRFIDLDLLVEKQCGSSIAELFSKKGEGYFRELESKLLLVTIKENNNAIIALGGGALIDNKNRIAIQENDFLVYLKADARSILTRVSHDTNERPLLASYKSKEDRLQFIKEHLKERKEQYLKAQISIKTDEKSIEEIRTELIVMLKIKSIVNDKTN
jgi:shikimate kinase